MKAVAKKFANKNNTSAQLVMQNFMFERLLERISVSQYKKNFILKGGFLIASMVGLDSRTTMDMDATIKGFPVNDIAIREMLENVCKIELDDGIVFEFRYITEIRKSDDYTGFRALLFAHYPPMSVPLKLDITTGDAITPNEIEYEYRLLFEDRIINVLAYNLETILAEKLKTVLSRGDQTTRTRDYYDIYALVYLKSEYLNVEKLTYALLATSKKRGSSERLKQYDSIMISVVQSEIMQKQWTEYQREFDYARDIKLSDCCRTVRVIMAKLQLQDQ